ncbi:hypothetical protein V2P11_09765, partial [Parageobacillus toebii]|uniref:hypothetical protein n=1 Tax=Parageobacillus toebii TaxID=153151 RepID=UPI0035C6777D
SLFTMQRNKIFPLMSLKNSFMWHKGYSVCLFLHGNYCNENCSTTVNKSNMDEYQSFIDELIRQNMMTPDDKHKLADLFDKTERQTLNVCPGLYFGYQWPKTEAIKLDSAGQLTDAIKEKIQEAARTWENSPTC